MHRWLGCALLMGTLLLHAPAWAQDGVTCGPDTSPGSGDGWFGFDDWGPFYSAYAAGEIGIDVLVAIAADGSADASGIAREPRGTTYRAVGATTQCADLDGDGINGLVSQTVDFEQVGNSDRPVRVEAEFILDEEAVTTGSYPGHVLWDGQPVGDGVLRLRTIPPRGVVEKR